MTLPIGIDSPFRLSARPVLVTIVAAIVLTANACVRFGFEPRDDAVAQSSQDARDAGFRADASRDAAALELGRGAQTNADLQPAPALDLGRDTQQPAADLDFGRDTQPGADLGQDLQVGQDVGPTAVSYAWRAFNDCVGPASGSAPNVTIYSGYLVGGGGFETPSGVLVDFDTGQPTSVTATLTANNVAGSIGGTPGASTPAGKLFGGVVNLAQSASYNVGDAGWSYDVVFSGLDPARSYTFITTADRNEPTYAGSGAESRWTRFVIEGADTFTNAGSSGVVTGAGEQLMNTGYNATGEVVGWSGITAADGSFTVRSKNVGASGPGSPTRSYGLQGFMLAEEQ